MAHRYKLLVIDDEQPILDEIKNYFEKRDFAVETALSGEEGLEKLRKQPFDVALIDLCMPQMSGLEVIQKINEELIPVSIAIITGHGGEKEAVAALNMGGIVHAWFTKGDYDMADLYQRVKELAQIIPEAKLDEFFSLFESTE
ncbi:putative Two-component response regulator [Crenothrix polyspora]|uniref:Putative Two-component response regulator n=1 Tax=Crenothrix polyspora TaxID=360316 RepID=A0A1R4HBB3_9GAMM|nr:response regulator [Crenothrix polyspora]SJM93160.1 putative Two-component response regulator [Crenothrix polyspora]